MSTLCLSGISVVHTTSVGCVVICLSFNNSFCGIQKDWIYFVLPLRPNLVNLIKIQGILFKNNIIVSCHRMKYAKEELWFIFWVILNRPCIDLVDPGLWDIKLQCLYIFLAIFLIWQGRWKAWVERYKCECWWRHQMPRPDAHLLHFLSYAYERLTGWLRILPVHSQRLTRTVILPATANH